MVVAPQARHGYIELFLGSRGERTVVGWRRAPAVVKDEKAKVALAKPLVDHFLATSAGRSHLFPTHRNENNATPESVGPIVLLQHTADAITGRTEKIGRENVRTKVTN